MPIYEFKCDECGHTKEIICPMAEIPDRRVPCPKCSGRPNAVKITSSGEYLNGWNADEAVVMRRVYTVTGVILKGDDWPGQALKRKKEDSDIQRQRRKACVLKDQGDVPQEHCLGLKESDRRFDQKYTEGQLGKLYEESTLHKPKSRKVK